MSRAPFRGTPSLERPCSPPPPGSGLRRVWLRSWASASVAAGAGLRALVCDMGGPARAASSGGWRCRCGSVFDLRPRPPAPGRLRSRRSRRGGRWHHPASLGPRRRRRGTPISGVRPKELEASRRGRESCISRASPLCGRGGEAEVQETCEERIWPLSLAQQTDGGKVRRSTARLVTVEEMGYAMNIVNNFQT